MHRFGLRGLEAPHCSDTHGQTAGLVAQGRRDDHIQAFRERHLAHFKQLFINLATHDAAIRSWSLGRAQEMLPVLGNRPR